MTTQLVIAIVFISLAVFVAVIALVSRIPNLFSIVPACCLLVLGSGLALWIAPDWAGWVTGALFALLIAWPIAFGSRSGVAVRRGDWDRASFLLKWATPAYRNAEARFDLELHEIFHAHDRGDTVAALARIETLASPLRKTMAYLALAFARRDWPSVLTYARADGIGFPQSLIEIRALGELGLVEEMVQSYNRPGRVFGFQRPEIMVIVLAFTGNVEHVEHLLKGVLRRFHEDEKSYWRAVAQLRKDPGDRAARDTLVRLTANAQRRGLGLAAAVHLQNVEENAGPLPPLSPDSQRVISGIIERMEGAQRRRSSQRRRIKVRWRAALLWILLIWIVAALREVYWGKGSLQRLEIHQIVPMR